MWRDKNQASRKALLDIPQGFMNYDRNIWNELMGFLFFLIDLASKSADFNFYFQKSRILVTFAMFSLQNWSRGYN